MNLSTAELSQDPGGSEALAVQLEVAVHLLQAPVKAFVFSQGEPDTVPTLFFSTHEIPSINKSNASQLKSCVPTRIVQRFARATSWTTQARVNRIEELGARLLSTAMVKLLPRPIQ